MTTRALHLGRRLDTTDDERLEIESDELTTHGVIVGMTGSGKTGLAICLLEEILGSGIPAIMLDPKGDLGNLLLNFPEFRASDFAPWVDHSAAKRDGISVDEFAAREAKRWQEGLAGSGIDSARMRQVREGVDLRLYTPGSTSGTPLNLVGDLRAPDVDWERDSETIRDEIEGLVSGLLVLAGIEADPLTSKEHILLSNLVEHAWRDGLALDVASLIRQVQSPPFRRLGVFELDTFYPERERMKLAMRLNGLVASPSFAEWLTGEPLDVDHLLYAPDGRPRGSIVYLAHLTDQERQFVVTLLLSKVVTWMRGQPGTSELKALVYADEVVGFAPPTAEPPTKRPILTLYKQARAHGVGVVMATQNPIDVDYKVMSNAGTWFVGRLQTERDKARIVEGLRSASGEVDVAEWDTRIGSLGKRQFLLKRAKKAMPSLFTTRWAMSYLRGPLTRADLLTLGLGGVAEQEVGARAAAAPKEPTLEADESSVAPRTADGVTVRYVHPSAGWRGDVGIGQGGKRLEPGIAARVHLLFDERVGEIRHEEEWEAVYFPIGDPFDASDAITVDHDPRDFTAEPPDDATWVLGGPSIDEASTFKEIERAIEEHLFRENTLQLFKNKTLKLYSRPGESEADFRARCESAAEDRADAEAEKLRDRFEKKLDTARQRLDDAERRVRELDTDLGQRKQQEVVAGASEILSMFLGGRRRVRSLSGMSSRRGMVRRTQERLQTAAERVEDRTDAIADLELELKEELDAIWAEWKGVADEVEPFDVPLERTDVKLDGLVLFWASRA